MAIDNIARGMASKALEGSSSGTTNYTELSNKPKINGIELMGAVSLDNLNVYPKDYVDTIVQDFEHDKMTLKRYVLATDMVTQLDATEIISNYANYEGGYIEFLTNGNLPNKTVGFGYLVTDKEGNQFLIAYNLDGTITQWNKSFYEKHNFETYSYINEPMVDLDSFTIDVQGNAPYMASVQNAINKPQYTSNYGIITVLAYSVTKQVQIYRDIETNSTFYRTVTGEADRHSFGVWESTQIIMYSPMGKKFKLVVSDNGELSTQEII